MDTKSINQILKEQEFFRDLDPDLLNVIAGAASIQNFESHTYLFYQGKTSESFYLVLEGSIGIQVYGGEAGFVTLEEAGPGEVVGWSWLLPPYQWVFSGEVLKSTQVITFNGITLRGICEENKRFGYELAKRFTHLITERLNQTRLKLLTYI